MSTLILILRCVFWWAAIGAVVAYLHDRSFDLWFVKQSEEDQQYLADHYFRSGPLAVNMLILVAHCFLVWPLVMAEHAYCNLIDHRSVWDGLVDELKSEADY